MKLTGTTLQTGYFGLKLLWHLPLLGLAFGCTWVKLLVPVMIGVGLATAAANALFTERCSVALALQVCLAAFFAAGFTSGAALEILLYRSAFAAYGYSKGTDENHLPVVDEPAASVVRRIFEMRSQGISPRHIANALNEEKILIPSDYQYAKLGKPNPRKTAHLWSTKTIKQIVRNPIYLGNLYLLRTTTLSYKNRKVVKKDEDDWIVIENTHEALVSQEIWDKCREIEASVSQGKKTKKGETMPLSGLMFCADCGEKMRLGTNNTTNGSKKLPRKYIRHNYQCGAYSRFGKFYCKSHYIKMKDIDAIVLADIRSMASLIVEDEEGAKKRFLAQKAIRNERQTAEDNRRLNDGKYRLNELQKLIPSIYEDKVLGKIPEDICSNLLEVVLILFIILYYFAFYI